jgi:hypothetical protein
MHEGVDRWRPASRLLAGEDGREHTGSIFGLRLVTIYPSGHIASGQRPHGIFVLTRCTLRAAVISHKLLKIIEYFERLRSIEWIARQSAAAVRGRAPSLARRGSSLARDIVLFAARPRLSKSPHTSIRCAAHLEHVDRRVV